MLKKTSITLPDDGTTKENKPIKINLAKQKEEKTENKTAPEITEFAKKALNAPDPVFPTEKTIIKERNEKIEKMTTKPVNAEKKAPVTLKNKTIQLPARIIKNPFISAKKRGKRVKMFLWGDFGTGKTTLALRFPGVVAIDFERGSEQYADDFNFDILPTRHSSVIKQMNDAVDFLLTGNHEYKTLVIDPITLYWEELQEKWNAIFKIRNKSSAGYKHEFYDFQVKDWQTCKAEFKFFIRKLIALDMNVVVTAREKTKYKEGSFMVADGETFDGEKSLPYMFDTILRLYKDKKGKYMAHVQKDRCLTSRFPKEDFEISYDIIEKSLGKGYLEKETDLSMMVEIEEFDPQEVVSTLKNVNVIPVEVKDYLISEINITKIKKLCKKLKIDEYKMNSRLKNYGVEKLIDLSAENAKTIIKKLEAAINK